MPQHDISQATASDLTAEFLGKTTEVETFNVPSEQTDAPTGDSEFRWQMSDWEDNLGYYKHIPELKTAIDAKTNWTLGAGYKSDEETALILIDIKGNGKDTFNSILKNAQLVKTLAGDSFTEIIRGDDGNLINLKPLDPSSIVIISDAKGIIKSYEQVSKTKKVLNSFEPDEILHLSRERVADEVHGTSIIPAVKWIINARNEAMSDWKRVLHRNVAPWFIFHLDTDDAAEIAAFKASNDAARKDGENMYVPKGVVEPEQVTTAQASTLNPLAWIQQLNDYFFQVVNVPQIVVGNAKEFTDASGKIVYLAFEQSVKGEQLYMEEQLLQQVGIEIELTFPASLQNEVISDTPSMELEEEPMEPAAQPNDTTSEMEGKN